MPGARAAQGASPGDVPCPACAQRPGGPAAPVSLALEAVPGSQRRDQQPHRSASTPSLSSPSRRRPCCTLRPLAAPCPCPAQFLTSFSSGLLSYPERPSWLGSRCTPGRSAELLGPQDFLRSEGKAAPGSREEMPESGALRGGRPPPGLRLDRRRVARGTSGRAGDCPPKGYSRAPSWKAEQRRPGSGAVAASDPAVTGKLPEEGSQPHRPALPSPAPPPARPAGGGVAGPGRKWPLAV